MIKAYLNEISFEYPYLLLLLITVPLIIVWYILKYRKSYPRLRISNLEWFNSKPKISFRQRIFHLPFILRMLALTALIIAISRPQSTSKRTEREREGIDIIMSLDVSGSMKAMDLKPDRLEAAKNVAKEFIAKRPDDRIGLTVFSGEAYTQCPLTTDHKVLNALFDKIDNTNIEQGTAIGDGLATSVNRIKDSEAISKVIILLTDGVQNVGSLDPKSAAEIAKVYGIRVYTIGVGTRGKAPIKVDGFFGPQTTMMDVKIDEEVLKEVSSITEGKYFRATDNESLKEIYNTIDKLEKSKIDEYVFENKHEEYLSFAIFAFALFFFDILLRLTVLRTKP